MIKGIYDECFIRRQGPTKLLRVFGTKISCGPRIYTSIITFLCIALSPSDKQLSRFK